MSIFNLSRPRLTIAIVTVVVIAGLGALGAIRVDARSTAQAAPPPAPEVDVATVVERTITDWQTYSGRLEAVERVDIRPQVSGTIVSVNFKDGALVKKGDTLFVIDPRPYAAEVDRAAAQLAAAQARTGYTQSDWERAQRLITDNAIAKRDYDENDADEQTYLQYINRAKDGRKVPVDLGLANESGYSRAGTIDSVDNRLDTSSGTIRVRARFDNADGTLVPGLYARIKVGGSEPHPALLIDDAAIGTDQDKKFVFVVDNDNHVVYREVQTAGQQGNLRVITAGLKSGDRIVVNGTQRVRPGAEVRAHMVPMTGDVDANGEPVAQTQTRAKAAKNS